MAIQVNGTTVIDNSRALTNIASVDATTVAALGAAGVGGSDVTWTDLPNTYSWTFTPNNSPLYDSGLLNASTVLSGMPSNFKYFMLIWKFHLQSTSNFYLYMTPDSQVCEFRLGNSSSSYNRQTGQIVTPVSYQFMYGTGYSSPSNLNNARYIVAVYDNTPPDTLPKASVFRNPTTPNKTVYQGSDGIALVPNAILPKTGPNVSSNGDWSVEGFGTMGNNNTRVQGINMSDDLNYLAVRWKTGYSSSNGSSGSITATVAGAYVAA